FFSSRRRHTRFSRDWSSDVCSSDLWAETFSSGDAIRGAPGTASFGQIQSGALESSNVDLTQQLVNMITAQRNFQANAQVISTAEIGRASCRERVEIRVAAEAAEETK